ncbi:MAG: hypothetical protein R3D66_00950 [Alphaproteobacteria bacterium]
MIKEELNDASAGTPQCGPTNEASQFDWDQWPEPDLGSAGAVLPFSTVENVFRKIMRAVNNQEEAHGIEADVNSIEFLNHYTRHHDMPNAEAQAGFPTASLRLTSHHNGSMIDVVALKDRRELLLVSQSAVIGMGDYSHFRDDAAFQQALLNRLPRGIGDTLKDIMYPDGAENRNLRKETAREIHESVLRVTL